MHSNISIVSIVSKMRVYDDAMLPVYCHETQVQNTTSMQLRFMGYTTM